MSKLLRKPSKPVHLGAPGRFEGFGLTENPFPPEPSVNQDSLDKRMNGRIYETEIHSNEFEQIRKYFLKQPKSDGGHLRLGYIVDTSYIGRGNGKSAFLVNLQQLINKEYCLDISNGLNKNFAVYVRPEPGGRTKAFASFVDVFFQAIAKSGIIESCLAILRLEAMKHFLDNTHSLIKDYDDAALVTCLNDENWFAQQKLDLSKVIEETERNEHLQRLPEHFPLFKGRSSWTRPLVSKSDFEDYYWNYLKKSKERIDFVFSHLVDFFLAAEFNGAYVLVDDFERVPDFQSERQKRDFALELRSCLFDGLYTSARVGFYCFLLVFHAGVPRLIGEAWDASGMEHRAPISPRVASRHVIKFEKLSKDHASLLLQKYLAEYRTPATAPNPLLPFKDDAVEKIGELSEYNAAKILKMAYELLEIAAESPKTGVIDAKFVDQHRDMLEDESTKRVPTITDTGAEDLREKARRRKS